MWLCPFFLPCVSRARPCVIVPPNAGDNQRRRFSVLAVRNTPNSYKESNSDASWDLFPSEQH